MRGLFDLNEHLLLSHPDFPAQHDLPRLPDADAVCPRDSQLRASEGNRNGHSGASGSANGGGEAAASETACKSAGQGAHSLTLRLFPTTASSFTEQAYEVSAKTVGLPLWLAELLPTVGNGP